MNAVKCVFLYLCFKSEIHVIIFWLVFKLTMTCISKFIFRNWELVHQPHYWMATNMYFWSWRSGTLVNVWFSISFQENTECPRFCQVQSTIFSHKFSPITHNFWEKKTFTISWLSLEPGFINHMLAQLCVTRWWSCVGRTESV